MLWLINAVLFYILVPGVLFRLPPSGPLLHQVAVHAIIFVILHHAIAHYLRREMMVNPDTRVDNPCPPYYEQCPSGDCRLASEVHSFCQ